MRVTPLVLALAAAAGFTAAQAAGVVDVSFVNPQQFADAGRGSVEIEHNTKILAEHLQGLAKRLPDGQTLKVEVLDVDLAGEVKPFFRHRDDVRVLKGTADWPRITLRYTLAAGGRTLASGEERVADLNYMQDLHGYRSQQALAHERRMLDRWFDELIARSH